MICEERACKFEKLVACDADGEQKLPSREIVKGVLSVAEEEACEHSCYQHYTSLRAFRKIFNPITPGLLFSRIDSLRLNDHNEWRKYAAGSIPNAFMGCFSHVSAESANLWWLYAQGKRQSLCISFPRDAFAAWSDGLSRCVKANKDLLTIRRRGRCERNDLSACWKKPIVSDVVYLAVKGETDRYPQDRQNVMSWEECRAHVENLHGEVFDKGYIGRFKDYEWKDERETRIVMRMKKFDDGIVKVGVPLTKDIIPKLRITVGPWATPKDIKVIRAQVESLLKPFGWKLTQRSFRASVLSGAMSALKD